MVSDARALRRAGLALAFAGFDPRATLRSLLGFPRYVHDYRHFRRLSVERGALPPRWTRALPALNDAGAEAGTAGSEYFLADLWVARRVYDARPTRHVDVGSRIDGLIGHLLTFRDVDVIDIRPLESSVEGLRFVQSDATTLDAVPAGSVPSVSSVHALEHFGLGRYGDSIDPDGHVKALHALGKIVAPGGELYVGVPVGRPAIEFNAHRILDPTFILDELPAFELVAFAAIVEGRLAEDVTPPDLADVPYACGLYHLRRP